MGIQVIPAGASVVVTDDEHRRDRGSKHPDRWDLSVEMQRNFDQVTKNQADLAAAAALASGHTNDLTKVGFTAGALASTVTDSKMDHGFGHGFEKQAHYGERAADAFSSAVIEAAKNAAALSVQAEANTSALGIQGDKNAAALGLQATTFAGQGSVEASKNAAALSLQVDKNWYALTVQSQVIASEAQLRAQTYASEAAIREGVAELSRERLAAVAAAKAAECCCELKSAIAADGQKTRDLINSQEVDRLRDKAAMAEQKLAAYYSAQKAPVTP